MKKREKIIKDGQIALFKKYRGGSRNGLLVLAECYDIQDADFGSCYTFKEYESQKLIDENQWKHEKIILKPKSYDKTYTEIILTNDEESKKFNIIGIFERVIEY
jgi:hypothetical protein